MIITFSIPQKDDNNDDNNDDNQDNGNNSNDSSDSKNEPENKGTLILDATCAPQNIAYPQDVNLLNECREKLEKLIVGICKDFGYYAPRMYRKKGKKGLSQFGKIQKASHKMFQKSNKATTSVYLPRPEIC